MSTSATPSPSEVALEIIERVCRLSAGDIGQVDALAALYAESCDVRHPMNPMGDHPLMSREAIREHFASVPVGAMERMEAVDVHVRETTDPEVVVEEFTYLVHVGDRVTRVPNIYVIRVRDGVVVESRDYVHHLGLAQATGGVADLLSALAG